jgi:creatinine amidohydrolase/Fe(II)-dependent formamide hydrolase-like protein
MLQGPKASYYRDMKEMTSNGVFGEPMAASPGKGKLIVSCIIESLKQIVIELNTLI